MRRLINYLNSRIRFKIILPFAILTLMVSIAGVYFSVRLVSDSLDERFTRQLIEAASVAADVLTQREQLHLSVLRAIAFTEGIDEAILADDRARLESIVFPHVINNNIGRVEVINADGLQLLEIRRPPGTKAVEDYSRTENHAQIRLPIVDKVLSGVIDSEGDKHFALINVNGENLFATAGPVKQDDKIVGVILVASYSQDLLRSLAQTTFSEVSLYNPRGELLDTTFFDNEETIATLTIDPQVRNLLAAEGGTSLQRAVIFNGREYDLLINTLSARGQALGFYSVAQQTTFINLQGNAYRNQMALVFSLTILLVFGIGYLTANAITGRVQHLMENAMAVAGGDFTRRTDISAGDEIGLLARSLDHMTDSLANYTDALQDRIDELIALYESSTAVTVKLGMNLEQLLQTISASVKGVVRGTDQVIIYLLDQPGQVLIPQPATAKDAAQFPPLTFTSANGIGNLLETVQPKVVSIDTFNAYTATGSFSNHQAGSVTIAPLIAGQEIIGMLALLPRVENSTASLLDDDSERLLGTLANQAAVVIKNAQLFEATQQAYEELRQLDDLKTKFINIAAHELRTPLGAMLGYASFVQKRVPAELSKATRFLVASTLRMRTMIDAMLAIQRLDAGTTFLRVSTIDIRDIIKKSIMDFQPIADLEKHTLTANLPDQLPSIEADAEKIGLILSNLLSNAIKFTPEGGLIEVSAQDYIKGILVSVRDNGVGISTEDQKQIFERFYQVRAEHIAGHGGIGIGLTIVKHMVELHEGQVWVESETGKGSTFSFTIPRREPGEPPLASSLSADTQTEQIDKVALLETI